MKRRRLSWLNLRVASWAVAAMLAALWVSNWIFAERYWASWFLHSMPQAGYVVLPFGLLIAGIIKRRRKVVSFALLALATFPFAFLGFVWGTPLPKADGEFVIVTFNIHGGESPLPPIESAIKEMDADIVCLQETGGASRHELVGEIANRLGYDSFVQNGDIAVLSRFRIKRSEVFFLEGNVRARDGLEATIDIEGREVTVVSVHLIPLLHDQIIKAGLPEGIETMRMVSWCGMEQARQISERYRRWRRPVIVAGDFNFNPNGLRYRKMASVFDDAFASVGRGFGYTIKSTFPTMRIDYVWTRNLTPVTARPYPSTASDHKPLVVSLRLD